MENREEDAWDVFLAEQAKRDEENWQDYLEAKYSDNLSLENVDLAFRIAGVQVTTECLEFMLKVFKELNLKGKQLTVNEILAIV